MKAAPTLAALLYLGCAPAAFVPGAPGDAPPPVVPEGAPARRAPGAAPAGVATLTVTHLFTAPPRYVEGSTSLLGLHGPAGLLRLEQFPDGGGCLDDGYQCSRVTYTLPPGRYRLETFELVCDGNCATVGGARDLCHGALELTDGAAVRRTARVTPGQGCSLEAQ